MGKLEKRITRIEKRMGKPDLLGDLTFEELWGIVCDHDWTDLELDTPCQNLLLSHFTYRQLIAIAQGAHENHQETA
jgi:hypothetical protein